MMNREKGGGGEQDTGPSNAHRAGNDPSTIEAIGLLPAHATVHSPMTRIARPGPAIPTSMACAAEPATRPATPAAKAAAVLTQMLGTSAKMTMEPPRMASAVAARRADCDFRRGSSAPRTLPAPQRERK